MWPLPALPALSTPETKSLIGVLFATGGNILISVAFNIQKKAHNDLQVTDPDVLTHCSQPCSPASHTPIYLSTGPSVHAPVVSHAGCQQDPISDLLGIEPVGTKVNTLSQKENDTRYLHSKSWWLGMVMIIFGETGNFIAYGFAPASVVAPLGTVTLISNALLAPIMLQERFRRRDLLGIVLAVCGAVVVVMSSKTEEIQLSPQAIEAALRQPKFLIYLACTSVVSCVMTGLSVNVGHKNSLIDLSLVAIYGGYTVLATKALSSLLGLTFYRMFEYGITYAMILVLVTTAILQIKYLNKALQRFDSTEVIPIQWTLFTISAILGSSILYNDFNQMTKGKAATFLTGCLLTFAGVYSIASDRNTHESLAATIAFRDEEERGSLLERNTNLPNAVASTSSRRASLISSLVVPPLTSPSTSSWLAKQSMDSSSSSTRYLLAS